MSQLIDNLRAMRGVWHDHLTAYAPDGSPVGDDPYGGVPGPFPYDNLVYIDFDGVDYFQTNVTFAGRPKHVRSFHARVTDGVLRFDKLGPEAPSHVGVSGGPGVIWYLPEQVDDAWQRYSEPDHIRLLGADQRTRVTVLYRGGRLVRTMTVAGTRISTDPTRRVALDPRGADGPVHDEHSVTYVFSSKEREQ